MKEADCQRLFTGLVHHPVLDRGGRIVTTSITSLDIHDIARSSRTFGVSGFYMINRLKSQRSILDQMMSFWQSETGRKYNPDRVEALSLLHCVSSVEEATQEIAIQEGMTPFVCTTSARSRKNMITCEELSELSIDTPVLILFGTGNGLSDELHRKADGSLVPVNGTGDYNHLSVRSAVAIYLDRIRRSVSRPDETMPSTSEG